MMQTIRNGQPTRNAYGEEIFRLGTENPNIYVIDSDVGKSCKTGDFARLLPDQYINVGIAEQNSCGIAAGLATCGKIPFVTTYAVFGSMRMLEQIRQSVCYTRLNVKFACSHGGLTPANDGGSHQCIEDMGILRTIPNMTVVMPADYYSAKKLIRAAVDYDGPVYLRLTRDAVPFVYSEQDNFTIGKANIIRDGSDISLIANGDTLSLAVSASEKLALRGINAQIIDMHTIKPIDAKTVRSAAMTTGRIITIEDHNIINGLGSAVCEIVAELGKGIVKRIGVRDCFGESAPYGRLLEKNGITVDEIVAESEKLLHIL